MRVGAVAALMLALATGRGALAQPCPTPQFVRANVPGFGDYQNSFSWSMQWFNGKLYVGTNRNFNCVEEKTIDFYYPSLHAYPPVDTAPCAGCPDDFNTLDLRAEIWCLNPANMSWTRIYQSPNDLDNPDEPGRPVARDIGFRGMITFTEADGTDALYVAGVSAREILPGLPPPRLLRSTDGVNFAPVNFQFPDAPGTFMGFRAMAVYKRKLFLTATTGLLGAGYLAVSDDPKSGQFRLAAPSSLRAYELEVFNDRLYVGAGDRTAGYSVWRTDATGSPPYRTTSVVTSGAGRHSTIASVVSMHPFNGYLYIGAAGWYTALPQCEMIRIAPNDSWEVVVGDARRDPITRRMKTPISGLPDGFGNPFNAHIWRMEDLGGVLYAGTNDRSWTYRSLASFDPSLVNEFGFDLFASCDGVSWSAVTRNGFGSPTSFGCRSLQATPVGLFLGDASDCIGTSVYLAQTAPAANAVGRAVPAPPLAGPPAIGLVVSTPAADPGFEPEPLTLAPLSLALPRRSAAGPGDRSEGRVRPAPEPAPAKPD